MTKIHALLVGINAYPSAPLRGCVNDALAMGHFFQALCAQNGYEWQPNYLLAPHADEAPSLAERGAQAYGQPTRQNLINGLEHLASDAVRDGDICLFFYSGHGSQEPAAPEFAHLKSDGMNETLVCSDSRNPGGRDLVDKELAWLLWRITERKPNCHLLLVMDCCHSGNNTRGTDDSIRTRDMAARSSGTAFQHLLGMGQLPENQRVFRIQDGRAEYRAEARYVHLAAARDSETAKELIIEGQQRGAFTWSLLRVLEQGGVGLSYREVMRRTVTLVRNRVKEQIPQMDAREQAVFRFLGQEMAPYHPEYPVIFTNGEWRVLAGRVQGVLPGSTAHPTVFQLNKKNVAVRASAVFAQYSLLEADVFDYEDRGDTDFRATLTSSPTPRILLHIDMAHNSPEREKLAQALAKRALQYSVFDLENSQNGHDYSVTTDAKGQYMLLKPDSRVPVFLRQDLPETFVDFCECVGRWRFMQELHNPETQIRADELTIEVEVIENQDIKPDNINFLNGEKRDPYQPLVLRYRNGWQPALRCSLRVKNRPLWVGGMYLDGQFGAHKYLTPRLLLPNDKAPHRFEYREGEATFNAIPLQIETPLKQRGVGRVTEYLKVFVSTQDFSLDDLEQASLPVDVEEVKRAGFDQKPAPARPDWTVITIPFELVDESVLADTGFARLKTPEGLTLKHQWFSAAQLRERIEATPLTRGEAEDLKKYLLPPASLWGKSEGEAQAFASRSFEMMEESVPNMLEINDIEGQLTAPIRLELAEKPEEDEVIIPYGYDPETELYIPLGYTNAEGDVEIFALPPATPGVLKDESDLSERSFKKSVKLFFRKLFRRKLENRLYIARPDGSTLDDKAQITNILAQNGDILLVTHGIFGNTEDKKAAVLQATEIHRNYCAVLAYDYENLGTDLRVTARDLLAQLKAVGACDAARGRRLVIVAPSMGGLVCRWMIEKEGAAPFVKQLLLVATPSLGSELSIFRKRLFGLIGRALNGSALLKPYLIPLSFLAKKSEKTFWKTLNDLDPNKSEFLKELNINALQPEGVRYSLLGGDVKGITMQPKNEGNFWSRLKRFVLKGAAFLVVDWLVFDGPHDMAVEVESQKAVSWLSADDTTIVPLDHLSYFVEEEGQKALEKYLIPTA